MMYYYTCVCVCQCNELFDMKVYACMQSHFCNTGKRFASPIKPGKRSNHAKGRDMDKYLREHSCTPSTSGSTKSASPPVETVEPSSSESITPAPDLECQSALLAHMEILESEHSKLKQKIGKVDYFRIEDIKENDKLISFYTGFVSYLVLSYFFEFLGPVVNNLNYWGSRNKTSR